MDEDFEPLGNLEPTTTSTDNAPNFLMDDDEDGFAREDNNNVHSANHSDPSMEVMTTTDSASVLNPLGVVVSSSSVESSNYNHVPPPIGLASNHLVLNNLTGIYVGCDNPYATPRRKEEPTQDSLDDDPFDTNNIEIEDDDAPQKQRNTSQQHVTENRNHRHDDAPGVQYGSHRELFTGSNNITSRVVSPQHQFSPQVNDEFHDVDLGNPTPNSTRSTQAFFTSNPLYPMATISETMSLQSTSPYSKPDPNASPSAGRYRPSLDLPLPNIPTLQGSSENNENSMFRSVHQPTITIHITEDGGELGVSSVERRFSNAVVVSVALFFIGLPFLSCFPFLLLFPYRHSNVARIRSLGHISVVIFNMLCVLNLVLLLCLSVPIFFVLIVNGIVYSNSEVGNK